MVNVLGLDVGGANTKASFIETRNAKVKDLRTALEYFPVWKGGGNGLSDVLERLKDCLVDGVELDGVGVTVTAELSDAYQTKKEGVNHVLDCVCQVFEGVPVLFSMLKI